jgi:hypothetical protein
MLQPKAVELLTAAVQVIAVLLIEQVPLDGVQLCTVSVYPVVVWEVEKLAYMPVSVMARGAMLTAPAAVLVDCAVLHMLYAVLVVVAEATLPLMIAEVMPLPLAAAHVPPSFKNRPLLPVQLVNSP